MVMVIMKRSVSEYMDYRTCKKLNGRQVAFARMAT